MNGQEFPQFDQYREISTNNGANNAYVMQLRRERRQPHERIAPEVLASLINGIPHGKAALVTIYLLKNPEALQAHPQGVKSEDIRQGMSRMLGLSESEITDYFGDHTRFSQLMNNLPAEVIHREGEGPQAIYSIQREIQPEALQFAELMLAHSYEHRVPFDAFFIKDTLSIKRDATLPLRFQVARSLVDRFSKSPNQSVQPAELQTELGTDTKAIKSAIIYHLNALRLLGIDYGKRPGEARYYVELDQLPENMPAEADNVKKGEVLYQALLNLKHRIQGGQFTTADIHRELILLDPYFNTVNDFSYFNSAVIPFLANFGIERQAIGAKASSATDISSLVGSIRMIENQDTEEIDRRTEVIQALGQDSESAYVLARSLWNQSKNFNAKQLIPTAEEAAQNRKGRRTTVGEETMPVQKEYSPLPISEHLTTETFRLFIDEINTFRKVLITQTLLENIDLYPNGVTIRVLRREVAKKLGLTTHEEINQVLGSRNAFHDVCTQMEDHAITLDRSSGIIQLQVNEQYKQPLQEYVALLMDFNSNHETSFEYFLPRRSDEIQGIRNFPLLIEIEAIIADRLIPNGHPNNQVILKDEFVRVFGQSYENVNRILRLYRDANLISLDEILSGESEFWFRLTDTAPETMDFPSQLHADVYSLFVKLRERNVLEMYSRAAVIHQLQQVFPERYGPDALKVDPKTFERNIYNVVSANSFPEHTFHVYQKIPKVYINPKNDFQSLYDFRQILKRMEEGKTPIEAIEDIFQDGQFVADFIKNEQTLQARTMWEQSVQLEPKSRMRQIENVAANINRILLHLPNNAGKTKDLLPYLNKSMERTQEVLSYMRKSWQLIGIRENRDMIWKLPNEVEMLEMKYLQVLTDGGVIRISGTGANLEVAVYSIRSQEYDEITQGMREIIDDYPDPAVPIHNLITGERDLIIKSNALHFYLDPETGRFTHMNYEKYMELLVYMNIALYSEYQRIRESSQDLPKLLPFHAGQFAQWLAEVIPNAHDAVHPTVPLGKFSRRRIDSLVYEPEIHEISIEAAPEQTTEITQVQITPAVTTTTREELPSFPSLRPVSYLDNEVLSTITRYDKTFKDLTESERNELWYNYQNARSEKIKSSYEERIYQLNIGLVMNVAKGYAGYGVPLIDLVQDGSIGLLTAIRNFEPEREYAFSTYATFWIRQAISRAIANDSRLVRLPVHVHNPVSKYVKQKNQLYQMLGVEPTPEDMMEHYSLSEDEIFEKEALVNISRIQSLDAPLPTSQAEARTLLEVIADEFNFTEQLEQQETLVELSESVNNMLSSLTQRQREIIAYRYGLVDDHEWTLEELGKKYKVTRERIRQIEAQALRILRGEEEPRNR